MGQWIRGHFREAQRIVIILDFREAQRFRGQNSKNLPPQDSILLVSSAVLEP